VRACGFEDMRLQSEDVAEFDYAPGRCRRGTEVPVRRGPRELESEDARMPQRQPREAFPTEKAAGRGC
jgi:hypothetical protein